MYLNINLPIGILVYDWYISINIAIFDMNNYIMKIIFTIFKLN